MNNRTQTVSCMRSQRTKRNHVIEFHGCSCGPETLGENIVRLLLRNRLGVDAVVKRT